MYVRTIDITKKLYYNVRKMKIIDKLYKEHKPLYHLDSICDIDHSLFVDIETTGLKRETTSLYLIGCGYYTEEGFFTRLFFADDRSEEEAVLKEFASFLSGFSYLIHFNGMKFDIPYLTYKAKQYGMDELFVSKQQIDVYRLCKPLRYLLFPDSMRQKAIEAFLDIQRDDTYDGGQLIEVYEQYEKTGSDELLQLLITHNREDVLGMHMILPILYYLDLKDCDISYKGYEICGYNDIYGNRCEEVIFEYKAKIPPLPRPFNAKTDTMYLRSSASGDLKIRLPLYDTEMKTYFDNYKDYRYLPGEDTVIPRSLAESLPKDRYIKATRETCCKKISARFMKQPEGIFTPVFKTSFKDKARYFRFPEDFNKEAADEFGRCLINVFFNMRKRS